MNKKECINPKCKNKVPDDCMFCGLCIKSANKKITKRIIGIKFKEIKNWQFTLDEEEFKELEKLGSAERKKELINMCEDCVNSQRHTVNIGSIDMNSIQIT